MNIQPKLLKSLLRVGYLACFKGLVEKGQIIMEGVHAARSNQIPVLIGLATARIYAAREDEAIAILRDRVLAAEPEHLTAKCLLGLALKQVGRTTESQRLLREVRERGNRDEQAIANAYLDS